jgi:tripartite-type tricarboxylate transporter receptor subunit TctC
MHRASLCWITALLCVSVSVSARAQEYPSKPMHLIVPYAPGGAVDLTARLMQPHLSAALGQPVVVDNRPGAAGRIGAELVSRAVPDGYTVMYTVGPDLAIRASQPGALDPARDLTPIASALASVSVIAARADLPLDSAAALIEYARRNPGKLTYGSAGVASTQHLTGERLKQQGIVLTHVPFKGVAPAMTALAAGEIDLAITNLATAAPQARQGRIKVLALTQARRFEGAPDVPAMNEALPGFDMPTSWYGFFGPPGLSRAIVAKWSVAIEAALAVPELRQQITTGAMTVVFASGRPFEALIRDTASAYGKLVETAGVPVD